MMSEKHGETLRELFVQYDMDWFLRAFPSDPQTLLSRFGHFAEKYREKLADANLSDSVPATVDVDALAKMAEENPIGAEAFLQLFASSASAEMLAMAWLLQHDARVATIGFDFEQRERFDLSISVRLGRGPETVTFQSDSVFDIAVLRHFGTIQANNTPIISGFYPLYLKWRSDVK